VGAIAIPLVVAVTVRQMVISKPIRDRYISLLNKAPPRFRVRVSAFGIDFLDEFARIGVGGIGRVMLITGVSWVINYFGTYLFGVSMGLNIGYFEMMSLSAVCSLIALVPISVLGVGTRDAALVLLLARWGGTSSDAIALSTLFLSLNVVTGLACTLSLFTPAANLNWREAKEAAADSRDSAENDQER
jgi:uncharacterized membrane protein YbhN (UPF0104 family)